MRKQRIRTEFHGQAPANGFWRLNGSCGEADNCPVYVNFIAPVVVEMKEFDGPHQHTDAVFGHGSIFTYIHMYIIAKNYVASRPAGTRFQKPPTSRVRLARHCAAS